MFVAHVSPAVASLEAAQLIAVADERPRLLFALTAGIGLGFLSGGTRPVTEGRGECRQIAIRAVILIMLGFLVSAIFDPRVHHPRRLRRRLPRDALAALPAAAGRPRSRHRAPRGHAGGRRAGRRKEFVAAVRETPVRFLSDWIVGGAYPVIIWVPVMLIGLALARMDLGSPRVVAGIALAGARRHPCCFRSPRSCRRPSS